MTLTLLRLVPGYSRLSAHHHVETSVSLVPSKTLFFLLIMVYASVRENSFLRKRKTLDTERRKIKKAKKIRNQ